MKNKENYPKDYQAEMASLDKLERRNTIRRFMRNEPLWDGPYSMGNRISCRLAEGIHARALLKILQIAFPNNKIRLKDSWSSLGQGAPRGAFHLFRITIWD